MTPAARLKRLREALGLSQREMAAQLGAGKSAVADWEQGASVPGPVLRLIELFERELFEGASEAAGLALPKPARAPHTAGRRAAQLAAVLSLVTLDRAIGRESRGHPISMVARQLVVRRLARKLADMRGLGMKVAQLLHGFTFAMPEPLRHELEQLHRSARPLPAGMAATIVFEALGESPRQRFAEWEASPVATASIGQVHRATLVSGERVAVKVQHPEIARALRADLQSLEALRGPSQLIFRRQDHPALYRSIRATLGAECDYLEEARRQTLFREAFRAWPDIVIPAAHPRHSSASVLTSDFVSGEPLSEWAERASPRRRQALARTVMRFVLHSFFEHTMLLGDPHPGNFMVSGRQLVLVDFGRVFFFDRPFVASWRQLLRALRADDRDATDAWTKQAFSIGANAPFDFDANYRMLQTLHAPWLSRGPFTFDSAFLRRQWDALFGDNPNRFRMNFSPHLATMHELHFGWFGLLARLGARGRWRDELDAYLV